MKSFILILISTFLFQFQSLGQYILEEESYWFNVEYAESIWEKLPCDRSYSTNDIIRINYDTIEGINFYGMLSTNLKLEETITFDLFYKFHTNSKVDSIAGRVIFEKDTLHYHDLITGKQQRFISKEKFERPGDIPTVTHLDLLLKQYGYKGLSEVFKGDSIQCECDKVWNINVIQDEHMSRIVSMNQKKVVFYTWEDKYKCKGKYKFKKDKIFRLKHKK